MIEILIIKALAIYALTVLITESYIFTGFRNLFERGLHKIRLSRYTSEGDYSFIECNMCVGVWMTALICLTSLPYIVVTTVAIYGIVLLFQLFEQ